MPPIGGNLPGANLPFGLREDWRKQGGDCFAQESRTISRLPAFLCSNEKIARAKNHFF